MNGTGKAWQEGSRTDGHARDLTRFIRLLGKQQHAERASEALIRDHSPALHHLMVVAAVVSSWLAQEPGLAQAKSQFAPEVDELRLGGRGSKSSALPGGHPTRD